MTSRRWPAAALFVVSSVVSATCGSPTVPASAPSSTVAAATAAATSAASDSSSGLPVAGPPTCPTTPPANPADDRPWWVDAVFYEVFVRSFADSDGDGIGDLRGLTAHLDDLNDGNPATHDDLGVTALWLMPVAESPSYHGYDVTDYRTIEPDYGTNDDFKALITAADERGIHVIVDLVMNHTSIDHPWFQDARTPGSEHDDWYVWSATRPEVSGPAGATVWHPDGDRFYYGYFWEGMPDLDLQNAAVTNELDSIARFWVDDMGVDGFRLDAARHLIEDGDQLADTPETLTWLKDFRSDVHANDPAALVLGETWTSTSAASRYVAEGSLDLTFDFDLASQFLSAVRFGDPNSLTVIQGDVSASYPPGGYAAFLTNHDQDRSFDVLGQDVAAAKQAATLLLTNPGVPFIYYGEEIGLQGRKPDERIRTPLPWTGEAPGYGFTTGEPWEAMADDVATTNVLAERPDPDSLLSHYRDLIALRAAHEALGTGASFVPLMTASAGVYAVLRHAPGGDTVVVVSNLGKEPATDVSLSLDAGPLCGGLATRTLLGIASAPEVAAPTVTATGGFADWPIGDLGPHQDLILQLAPTTD